MAAYRTVVAVGIAALALRCAPCAAQDAASDSGGTWALGLAAQVDEESNDSLLATLNWGVTPSTWLSFSAGRSSSPADRANVSADTLIAGVDHRFGSAGVAFEVEHWGDADALETADLRATFYFERERFRIGIAHEQRDIDVPFTLIGPLGGVLHRTAHLTSDSTALDARVSPAERWQIYFAAEEYDYERNLALLPRVDSLNLLSASTLTLANGFIDHARMIGVEREIGRILLNVSFTRDVSAVDASRFKTSEVAVLFPVARRVDLEVTLGRGRSDLLDSGLYGGVLFLIYGR